MATDNQRDFLDHDVLTRLSRLNLHPRGLVSGSLSGLHRSPHRGASVEFAEYRKYVPGDDIRHIDWRVYAKSDRFYLKEFEADTNLRCYIVVDCSGSMAFGSPLSKFAAGRRLAATLAHLLVRQNDHVGLQCVTDRLVHDIPARSNPSHLRVIYDTLAAVEPAGETDLVPVLHDLAERIRRRALVVIVSDLLTPLAPLLACFQHMRFRQHDLTVFQLLDKQEVDFDFERPIRFVDLETGSALLTEPRAVETAYRAALADHLAALRHGCDEFGVDYRQSLTSAPYEDVLSDFLVSRLR